MKIGAHNTNERVFIVAEAGNNHEGSFARAEELLMRAAECGADAIKFQTIVPERYVSVRNTARIEQLRRFQLSYEQFESLAALAHQKNIVFLSTPFDLESLRRVDALVPAIKIASGDNDFWPLLRAAARTGKPIILSTGMLDLAGVQRARRVIEQARSDARVDGELAVLHCVVAYPTPDEQANLGAIRDLATLGITVGYSDHTLGIEAACLSVGLGARIIEKHFTLDKQQSAFRDHQLSADPEELRELVRRVRLAERLIGTGGKRVMPVEEPNCIAARRAVVADRNLIAGSVVRAEDLTWVRPRHGLEPGREFELVGRRLAVDVARGEAVLPEMLVS